MMFVFIVCQKNVHIVNHFPVAKPVQMALSGGQEDFFVKSSCIKKPKIIYIKNNKFLTVKILEKLFF